MAIKSRAGKISNEKGLLGLQSFGLAPNQYSPCNKALVSVETKQQALTPSATGSSRISSDQTKRRFSAVWVSAAFHVVLLGLLAVWYLPKSESKPVGPMPAESAVARSAPLPEPVPPAAMLHAAPANVPAEEIRASLESQLQSTANRSEDFKLKTLDRNLERLDRVVKPESVNDLVAAVASSVNVDPTMYADKEPVAGTVFDPHTAQLIGVERKANVDGSWSYEAEMIDLNGNRARVPMTAAEGVTAYETFERIKGMPMAASFYQQLVMPLLQQMVAPENPRPAGNVVITPEPQRAEQSQMGNSVSDSDAVPQ